MRKSQDAVNWTLTYHGDPAGSVIGDERESGLGSNRGSELCTTIELMYSLSYMYQTIGDATFADRCELAAFNALPVSITSDHWQRQYLAVPNEPFADTLKNPTPFWNVGSDGIIYGLGKNRTLSRPSHPLMVAKERNYPCCTVNMPQGLPKFLSASFALSGENGIAHTLLGPAEVSTTTASGTQVTISCRTTYPFGSTLEYTVTADAPFTLQLRVPSWYVAKISSIELNHNGVEYPLDRDSFTGMTSVNVVAGTTHVTYKLAADLRVEHRANGSVAIYHGALLYALDIGQSITSVPMFLNESHFHYTKPFQRASAADFDTESDPPVMMPAHVSDVAFSSTKPWNIAIDPSSLVYHPSPNGEEPVHTLQNPIFDYEAPPSYITGKGCEIHWETFRGLPAALPKLPEGAVWQCLGNVTNVVLRPYGSLKIHMAELPTVDLRGRNASVVVKTADRRPDWWVHQQDSHGRGRGRRRGGGRGDGDGDGFDEA